MSTSRRTISLVVLLLLCILLSACGPSPEEMAATSVAETAAAATSSPTSTPTEESVQVTTTSERFGGIVTYATDPNYDGLKITNGQDVDTEIFQLPDSNKLAVKSGNGSPLPSEDGNDIPDNYIQFKVDDDFLYSGSPTSRIMFIIEYLDEGEDIFFIQYDALSGGPYGTGLLKETRLVRKKGTGEIQTEEILVFDANFENRYQDSDFRIVDNNDGAEIILSVAVRKITQPAGSTTINVDSCGANPFDNQPDSDAIQDCINQAYNGDTILFTSDDGDPDYQGYIIDKTIVLVHPTVKHKLTFTSTDPEKHALLIASEDLLGFVVQLYARSFITDDEEKGSIDDITFSHIDLDGNRDQRKCVGADGVEDGVDDNWGSWLDECDQPGDPWCSPGSLYMMGFVGEFYSTGIVVQDLTISNTECATALSYSGVEGMIDSVVINTAGDHVHGPGCEHTETDEAQYDWSDGMTLKAFNSEIINNTIINASDIGIVCFACPGTIIAGNTVIAEPGNYGMFAGIALHPWANGDFSGIEISDNVVMNQADETCGGIHMGINLGGHTWGAGCRENPSKYAIGNVGPCDPFSSPPQGQYCDPNQPCRVWGHIPAGESLILADNTVTGAQVNYVLEGVEVIGDLIVNNNISVTPRMTDWQTDANCTRDGITDSWGILDFVAHDPTLPGWTDQRIYCER